MSAYKIYCPQADRIRLQIKRIEVGRGLLKNKAIYLEESTKTTVRLGHIEKQMFK